jgi:hypothetical protein
MSVKDNICSTGTNPNVPFKGTIQQAGSSVSRENLQTVSQSFIIRILNVSSKTGHIEQTLRWGSSFYVQIHFQHKDNGVGTVCLILRQNMIVY